MSGWIKIHRQIQDCWLWQESEPFDKRSAWVDLILMANHSDKKFMFGGELVNVKRGQLITSVRKLAERWMWSTNKVYRFLGVLESDNMLQKESNSNRTLLTIVKYEVFQTLENTNEYTERTLTDTEVEHQRNTNKNVKNDKNVKNINNTRTRAWIPPTVEEVKAYCIERGNKVDPQAFVDFYTSKDWYIGKNKMKDWKASVRTWERQNQKRQGETAKHGFNNFESRSYDMSEMEKQLLGSGMQGKKDD